MISLVMDMACRHCGNIFPNGIHVILMDFPTNFRGHHLLNKCLDVPVLLCLDVPVLQLLDICMCDVL